MDFTMVIPASEFKDFQLKVVSLAPIKVSVIGHEDEVLEEFQTSANHSMYGFKTKNEAIKEVKCEVIPGVIYEFYPVVNNYGKKIKCSRNYFNITKLLV